eukprot:GHVS01000205.1.p1 GENE.GHVS01000205.1~~GHVS01000205.1.p1  ORF type:complete len:213 (+),score=17.67 GHVS01000205.1:44-682(+)
MVGGGGSSRFVPHAPPLGARFSRLFFVLAVFVLGWPGIYHDCTTPVSSAQNMFSLWNPITASAACAAELPPNSSPAATVVEAVKLESTIRETPVNEKTEAAPPGSTIFSQGGLSLLSSVIVYIQRYGPPSVISNDMAPPQLGEQGSLEGGSLRGLQAGISANQSQKSTKFNITLWVCLVLVVVLALAIYATFDIATFRDRLLYTKMRPQTVR